MERNDEGQKGGAVMGWTTPKTDWKITDRFNLTDYNRIRGNIEYLHEFAEELYGLFDIADLGADKTSYADYVYAREFNNMEDSLEIINDTVYTQDIGNTQTFESNGAFIDWSELNRIESAALKIYELLTRQKATLPRMAFTLGNGKGVRV